MSVSNWNSPAPGELESVRRLLNTWKILDGTREPTDELAGLLKYPGAWEERFPNQKLGLGDTENLLMSLRRDLREVLGEPEGWERVLNGWFEEYPLVARVSEGGGEPSIRYEPSSEAGFAGRILSAVAESMSGGTWSRLKVCPDCRWVFYDKSRSKTRVWCGMYAGDGGRACGTIAKVKRYRQKHQGSTSV